MSKSSRSNSKKKASLLPKHVETSEADLMEQFHPDEKICQIIPASPAKKKDVFSSFRPKDKQEYLDYNISQTDAKFDAGPTKIHFRQTRAKFQPRPAESIDEKTSVVVPVKKKMKPTKGHRGPVWIFEDEIRAAKYEIEQKIALKEMKARIARKTKYEKALRVYRHSQVVKNLGPIWFQELSPNQIKTVDELKTCIHLDLLKGTTFHTKENVGKLGLVLRPNPQHVEIALAYCCGSPVEFLLILYQVSNPKRVFYSLNDKLLLSAVVHLTLRETLRELHIRIPSPPKKKKSGGMKDKGVKSTPAINRKCKSAYLCTFTFEPTWGIHAEGYKDNHVQHPESPYFDYVEDLRKEIADNGSDQGEEDLYRTRRRCPASSFYDTSLERELDDELQVAQDKYNKLTKHKTLRLLRPSIYRRCSECFTKPEGFDSKLIMAATKHDDNTDLSLKIQVKITDQYNENNQHLGTNYNYQVGIKQSAQKINEDKFEGPTALTKDETVATDEEKHLSDVDDIASAQSCHCLDELGTSEEDSSSTTSNSGLLPSRKERVNQDLVEVKSPPPWNCTCKEIVEQYVEEVVEKRKECLDVCRKKQPTFIITDTKSEDGEKPIPIIAGVKAEKTCTCLERFKKKMKLFEERKLKQEVQDALKSTKQCYVINGVCMGIDGKPVYMLSGVAEERPCRKCLAMEAFQKQEEERLAHMPTLPSGRQKYAISGVQERPEGNVYIISGAVPIEQCECMELYKAFVRRHGKCIDLYEQYTQKVKSEVAEYMAEVETEEAQRNLEEEEEEEEEESNDKCKCQTDDFLTLYDKDKYEEVYCPCDKEDKGEEKEDDSGILITVEVGDSAKKTHKVSAGRKKLFLEFVETEMKRFIVLKKMPSDYKDQMKILKHSLKILAMDGYPLAKLPNVHKLPIFKLWMDMRCGTYWTWEDKRKYLNSSKFYLHYTGSCKTKVGYPEHHLTEKQSKRYTWCDAKFVKSYANAVNEEFYRRVKQCLIADGQEFFPTMCSYDFPTKSFRDCYFAYMPAKEEEVFAFKPWTSFDMRSFFTIRPSLRGRQTC